jgi:hypothetical protein
LDERELHRLYRARIKDRLQSKTRRRKELEAKPNKLGDLLGTYFGRDSEALRRLEEHRALQAWEGYVGAAACRVSKALRVRQGTLLVRVQDPLWMQQLSLLKRELIKRYRSDFPRLGIRDIFFTRN